MWPPVCCPTGSRCRSLRFAVPGLPVRGAGVSDSGHHVVGPGYPAAGCLGSGFLLFASTMRGCRASAGRPGRGLPSRRVLRGGYRASAGHPASVLPARRASWEVRLPYSPTVLLLYGESKGTTASTQRFLPAKPQVSDFSSARFQAAATMESPYRSRTFRRRAETASRGSRIGGLHGRLQRSSERDRPAGD